MDNNPRWYMHLWCRFWKHKMSRFQHYFPRLGSPVSLCRCGGQPCKGARRGGGDGGQHLEAWRSEWEDTATSASWRRRSQWRPTGLAESLGAWRTGPGLPRFKCYTGRHCHHDIPDHQRYQGFHIPGPWRKISSSICSNHCDYEQETSFSCVGRVVGGYYADPEQRCQAYHVCLQVQPESHISWSNSVLNCISSRLALLPSQTYHVCPVPSLNEYWN